MNMFNNGAFNQQDLLLNSLNQNSQPNHGMPPLGASGFTPEQQRLFHQMQMQQQAGGNQFRPQSGAGQDLMGGSSMNEMSALMGNAGIPARMNAQQQQLQQQQLAARGFNNNGQPTQQMLSMMGMGGGPANNRNSNPMLQAFPQGVLGASRQLDLMAAAQNQQNQNAPLHVQQMLFRQQQQQQQQQRAGLAGAGPSANLNGLRPGMGNGSTNMFPTSMDPRRTSPTHPQQNNMNGLANTMAGTANPQATLAQYNEKLQALRDSIVQMETELRQKTMQRAQGYLEISEDTLQTIATNLRIRKEHYTRLQSLVMRMRSGSIPNDGEHNLPGGSAGGPGQNGFPSQHGLGPSGSNQGAGPSSSPWMQNGGLGASFGVNGLQSGSQTSPANAAASLPQNVNAPPRSGPTPQSSLHATLGMQGTPQQSNSRLPSGSFSMSPSMSASLPFQQQSPAQNGAPFGGAGQLHPGLNGNPFPHLEKHRFEPIYNNFCSKHPDIKRDPRLFDGRPIDVYMLHVEVNREGGMNKVKANNAWPIIAARLGFAAPGPEPAKSTPDVAEQVAKCYQDCLGLFDTQLYQTMAETRRREMFMTMHNQANQATGGNNPAPNPAQLPALARLHPQQLQALVKYANLSVEHMRAQGLNASIIQLVENNRAGLQRYAMEQHAFRGSVKSGAAQNGMQQGVGSMAGPGGMPAENLALAGLQRPGLGGMGGGNIPQPQDIPIQLFVKVLDYLPLGESALQQATGLIERARVEFSNKGLQRLPNKDVAPELRGRLATIIHQTMQVAQLMDARLHRFFLLVRAENTTKSLISAFAILRKQHELLQGTQPRFVMGVEELSMTLLKMKECADLAINQGKQFIQKAHMQNPQMLAQRGLPPGPPPPPMDPPQNVPSHTLPPQPGPAGSAVPPRPPVNLQPPPIGKHKKNVSTPAASPAGGNVAPTPPPTTPAVTPAQMAASPSNVKSPKNKPATRPKPKPVRRPSKATAPTPPSTSTPATEPQTPTIGKRQREDDPAQSPINGPSPPKRAKAEEEIAAPSQLPEDKTANLESKTDQEVAACLDQMKELVQQASQGDGSSSMNANIAEAFDELLKQSISLPDASGDGSMDMPGPLDGSLGMGGVDDSLSFFDWTAYGINADAPDGSDSVAPTPDLLHSSTNTSPESAAGGDADAAHSGAGEKHEEEQVAAHLNVGIWKDIEGGSESLYHQAAAEWKWDGVMPTLDQPWAISSG